MSFTCPACSSALSWKEVPLTRPFDCPTCGRELHVRRLYARLITSAGLLTAGALAFVIGARGVTWLFVFALAFFPINMTLMWVVLVHYPPPVHLVDNVMSDKRSFRD